ncbi:MAG: hypothetical protein PSX80_04775 [bacterium]|nr:hypothetical protein [bacterium]
MRKKTPTNTNAATAAVNLDDDEQLVEEVTTTKRIGREKRKPASEEVITIEPDDDDDVDDAAPEFAENSLAAVLFGDSSESYDNQFCTIQIRRNPDSMNDRFLTPCGAVTNLPPLRNIELTAEKMDIEERVRSEYGGGHYYFQIYYNGALGRSWKSTLADDPAAVARAKAEKDAERSPTQPPLAAQAVPADPMDSMLNSIVKMKALKDALFGDEEKRLQREIDELKAKAESVPVTNPQPQSEQLYILEKALGTQSPALQEKLLDYAFPADSGGHWIPETVKTIFEHKEEIGGILAGLLGGLAPKPQSAASFADMMRGQPTQNAALSPQTDPAVLPTSSFRRRPTHTGSPATADNGETDGSGPQTILGEIVIEEPSPEFIASISINVDEVTIPFATEEPADSVDVEDKTDGE